MDRIKNFIVYGSAAVLIGIAVGLLDTVFGKGLAAVSSFREAHFGYMLVGLPFAGILVVYMFERFAKNTKKNTQLGMGMIFEGAHEEEEDIPFRLIPLSVIGTWITHLFGGSAGREGVAVQIGGTVSDHIGQLANKLRIRGFDYSKRVFIVSGIAAGFAGLFGTPMAAAVFSMEVLTVGRLEYKALYCAIISAFVSAGVSKRLGLSHFSKTIEGVPEMDIRMFLALAVLGAAFGLAARLFAYALGILKANTDRFDGKKRVADGGTALALMLFLLHQGRYSGLGTNLIESSFAGGTVYSYDWLLKLVFTVATLGIGFQGGEVTPLFSIGSSLGAVGGSLLGMDSAIAAAIGYAGVFGGATNTFLAPILIGAEVFGYEMMPLLFVGCGFSYVFSGRGGIYGKQKRGNL